MCVICVSERGKRQPSIDELKQMWKSNPDGAGYMYARSGAVHIRKGFMKWSDFVEAMARENFTADDAVVYHFRISTQGGVKAEMTHPFPLTNKLLITEMLRVRCSCGIAHNGIIPVTADANDKEYSDTARFITDYMTWIIQHRSDLRDEKKLEQIKRLIGRSKLAIMTTDGEIAKVGDFTDVDGIMVSNTYWQHDLNKFTLGYGKKRWWNR